MLIKSVFGSVALCAECIAEKMHADGYGFKTELKSIFVSPFVNIVETELKYGTIDI